MINFAIFTISLIGLFLVIDFLQKRVITSYAWSRKTTHVASGLLIMQFPKYLSANKIAVMSVIFVVILFVSKIKNILSLHNIKRFSWGEVYYPLSIGIIALMCLPNHVNSFYAGVLTLALSDAAAAVVGGVLPIKMLPFGRHCKSWGGFLGFFVSTLCVLLILYYPLGSSITIILAISLVLSFAEMVSFNGTDNLVVPIAAALLSMLLL